MTEVLQGELVKRGRGRPSTAVQVTGAKTVAARVTAIGKYHTLAREHAAQAAFYMVLCGYELLAVNATMEHGEWGPWVEANCPFNRHTAWKYMETAKRLKGGPQMFTAVNICQSGTSLLSLPAPEREKAIAAIKKATDGQTITQLYLDLDIVKPARTYEHIGGNADLRAWLAKTHPECKATRIEDCPKGIREEYAAWCDDQEAEKAAAAKDAPLKTAKEIAAANSRIRFDELVTGMREFVMQGHRHAHVELPVLKAGIESLKDCLRKLSEDYAKMSA